MVNGGSTVILNGTNNGYTGATYVYAGSTLKNGIPNALPASTTLTLGNSSDGSVINTYDLNGYDQTLTGLSSASNPTTSNINSITNGAASGVNTLALTGINLFGGIISDGFRAQTALAITGTTTLSGNNTYTGTTTIGTGSGASGSGTLILSGDNTVSQSPTNLYVGNGSTLKLANANATNGRFVKLYAGSNLQLRANSDTTFSGAGIIAQSPGGTFNIDVANNGSGTNQTLTIPQLVSSADGITIVVNVTGANGCTLKMRPVGSLNTFFVLNPTTANLVIDDSWTHNNLTFQGTGHTTVGTISDSQEHLVINGPGDVTFQGLTSISSGTGMDWTLNGGTLNLAQNTTGSSGVLADLVRINGGTIDNTSGSSIIAQRYNPSQIWGGNFTFTGTNALNLGTGSVTLAVTPTITVNGTGSTGVLSEPGNISGIYGITKAGSGSLILTGSNSYQGPTTVTAGSLTISSGLTSSGSFSIASGATLKLNQGVFSTSGTITNNGTIILSTGVLLSSTGTFINNGILDLTNDPAFVVPGNLINNGTIIPAIPVNPNSSPPGDIPTMPTWALLLMACLLFFCANRYLQKSLLKT